MTLSLTVTDSETQIVQLIVAEHNYAKEREAGPTMTFKIFMEYLRSTQSMIWPLLILTISNSSCRNSLKHQASARVASQNRKDLLGWLWEM